MFVLDPGQNVDFCALSGQNVDRCAWSGHNVDRCAWSGPTSIGTAWSGWMLTAKSLIGTCQVGHLKYPCSSMRVRGWGVGVGVSDLNGLD